MMRKSVSLPRIALLVGAVVFCLWTWRGIFDLAGAALSRLS